MKRYGFTLIEILVCLLMLSMAGSVAVYKGWDMLREHRFSTSCEKIRSEIALTKVLSVSYQMDIDLILEQKGRRVYVTRKTEFPVAAIKSFFQTPVVLSELSFDKEDGVKEIHFYGNGWIEGEEKIGFFMPQDTKKGYNVLVKHSSRVNI